jgi:endothelin-converting enzyme/putative endopeptidase
MHVCRHRLAAILSLFLSSSLACAARSGHSPPTSAFAEPGRLEAEPIALDAGPGDLSDGATAPKGNMQPGWDESALDTSTPACGDFYQFACGAWMNVTPIPDDESSWVRSFSVIHEENQKILRGILDRDARGDIRSDPYGAQLGNLWSSCMGNEDSTKDLVDDLSLVAGVHDPASLARAIARLQLIGVSAPFGFDSEVDFKDASRMIAAFSQAGLGLPERDYYFRDDARARALRDQYVAHVARTLELIGEPKKRADKDASTVMRLETDFAGSSMTNIELRDPKKVYHLMDRASLKNLAPEFPWDEYLTAIGSPAVDAINVAQPDFAKKVGALAKGHSFDDWTTYLKWHLLSSVSPWLPQAFVDEWFRFRQVLTGAKRLQPRWKRCVRFADEVMGEALARPFVADHLGEDGKSAARQMVADIEQSMKIDLDSLTWMDAATRDKAEAKLAKVSNKIGFPDKWRTYDGLEMDRRSFLKNMENGTVFEVRRRLAKAGKPVDRNEWEMTPPTVNAYYEPTMNEMVFPAGILQVPFYAKTQTAAENFGAIGMVVGHELTHGFDDEGRQFDGDGNLRDWWSKSVAAEFDKRAACVEKQFSAYVPIDDVHIKGALTLGENIADEGGVKLAFASYEREQKDRPTLGASPRFTPAQQFFLSFAQSWCANYRPEALRLLLATNPHSPPKYRVNGPLSNLPEFAAAFGCKSGAPMVRSERERCEIW